MRSGRETTHNLLGHSLYQQYRETFQKFCHFGTLWTVSAARHDQHQLDSVTTSKVLYSMSVAPLVGCTLRMFHFLSYTN